MEIHLVIAMEQDWRDIYGIYLNKQYAEQISKKLNTDAISRGKNITYYVKTMEVIEK